MDKEKIERIFSNPFYAINISESMCVEHTPIVSEETFIKAGVNLIAEIGAEKYLQNLLENLKGNYVVNADDQEIVDGYKTE